MAVEVGTQAPDFELKDQHGTPVRLSRAPGQESRAGLLPAGVQRRVHAVSSTRMRDEFVDTGPTTSRCSPFRSTPCSPTAPGRTRRVSTFPLLSDFWPHGRGRAGVRCLR